MLNLIISYPEERSVFKEKAYIEKLGKIIRHLVHVENKENNNKSPRTLELEHEQAVETKAYEHISENLIFVIHITSLQSYHQWISLYPNLEKLCSTRFINDNTKRKEIIQKKQAKGTDLETEVVVDACNFIVKNVKDFMLNKLLKNQDEDEHKKEENENQSELIAFQLNDNNSALKTQSLRTSGKTSAKLPIDNAESLKVHDNFSTYPKTTQITQDFFSEIRFKNFISTYNNLYTKIKANILKMKNNNLKYKANCEKIIEVYQTKGLIREAYNLSSESRQILATNASLSERIEELHAKIKEKEAIIKLKEKIIVEKSQIKQNLKSEIQASIDEKMDKLSSVLLKIEKIDSHDMHYVPSQYSQLSEPEKQQIEVLLSILFLKQIPDSKFSVFTSKCLDLLHDKAQLILILRARRDTNFSEGVMKKVKQYTQKYGPEKYDKEMFRQIASYIGHLDKKFNLKVLLEARYVKIEEVSQLLIQAELDINYYKLVIDDSKEELEDLMIKQKNSSEEMGKAIGTGVSDEEARNEQ